MKLTIQQLKKIIKEAILTEAPSIAPGKNPYAALGASVNDWAQNQNAGPKASQSPKGDPKRMQKSLDPLKKSSEKWIKQQNAGPTASKAPYKGLTFKSKNAEAVKQLQKLINLADIRPLEADGDFGSGTAYAVLQVKFGADLDAFDSKEVKHLIKHGHATVDTKTFKRIAAMAKKEFAKLVS